MQLTDAQLDAAECGEVVEIMDQGRGFVLLSRELYDQVRQSEESELPTSLATARLIREVMADDDANDPTLDSYQRYKRHS